ncbi:MAG: flagellar FliJ family protein [Rhodovibrio sp.]|nr:flagellar FliJ family protein [Rhodovibrio sp.]
MSALDNLVRISRWHLDEARQKLGDLERLEARLHDDVRRLDAQLADEQTAAQESEMARAAYPAYAEAQKLRRKRLERSIADVQNQIAEAREAVADAFREAKKYELARDNERARAKAKRDRAEAAQMDEMGLQLHRRKQGAGGDGR